MFTGIVEEIGTVLSVQKGGVSSRLTIAGQKIFKDVKLGDSIAVNGACLTVAEFSNTHFTADVMAETLRRTNLGSLKTGSIVNLERAMPADGRFGGHIVSGHIDGTGTIHSMKREENAVWVKIQAPSEVLRYVVEKGSISIDGISLTIAGLENSYILVSVIPHTAQETILMKKRPGDVVNLEGDIIGKYVEKLLSLGGPISNAAGGQYQRRTREQQSVRSNIDRAFLIENGF